MTLNKTSLFIFTLIPTFFFGQETIKVSDKKHKEVYYVLKSDKKTRQGLYQKLGCNDSIEIEGFYKNGQKDSLWTEWSCKGMFSQGKEIGVWEYYDYNGELEQKYDYTKNELLFYKITDEYKDKEFSVIIGSNTITAKLDRPPLYIGGVVTLVKAVFTNFKIPLNAKLNRISGVVEITFIIDSTGKTANHRVTKGIGYGWDKRTLKMVKQVPDKWLPAILNSNPVNVEYVLPVHYDSNKKLPL